MSLMNLPIESDSNGKNVDLLNLEIDDHTGNPEDKHSETVKNENEPSQGISQEKKDGEVKKENEIVPLNDSQSNKIIPELATPSSSDHIQLILNDDIEENKPSPTLTNYSEAKLKKPAQFSRPEDPNFFKFELETKKQETDKKYEVMCVTCGKMISGEMTDNHSKECFINPEKNKEENENNLTDVNRVNIVLSKLRECMLKSEVLKTILSEEFIEEVCDICKEGEDLFEATEKDICLVREKIAKLRKLQASLGEKPDSTAFNYLERIIFCLQVKNVEFGKIYNHMDFLSSSNKLRASIRSEIGEHDEKLFDQIESENSEEENKRDSGDIQIKKRRTCQAVLYSPSDIANSKKMLMKREFYGVCENVVKKLKKTNPKVLAMNKEKLFDYVNKNGISMEKWGETIIEICSSSDNFWINEKKSQTIEGEESPKLKRPHHSIASPI